MLCRHIGRFVKTLYFYLLSCQKTALLRPTFLSAVKNWKLAGHYCSHYRNKLQSMTEETVMVTVMSFIFFTQATQITGNSFYRIFPLKLKAIYSWENGHGKFLASGRDFFPETLPVLVLLRKARKSKFPAL